MDVDAMIEAFVNEHEPQPPRRFHVQLTETTLRMAVEALGHLLGDTDDPSTSDILRACRREIRGELAGIETATQEDARVEATLPLLLLKAHSRAQAMRDEVGDALATGG
jgi:hypothetical protein